MHGSHTEWKWLIAVLFTVSEWLHSINFTIKTQQYMLVLSPALTETIIIFEGLLSAMVTKLKDMILLYYCMCNN